MTNIGVAFNILDDDQSLPVVYAKANGHIVFHLRMDFTQKIRCVKNKNLTPRTLDSNFAGVVSRDSVRIAFTYAAMNNIDGWAAGIQKAYIQAPSSEKYYIICGPEFGIHKGKQSYVVRAPYGGVRSGRDYWLHLHSCMDFLGFSPCKADPGV